MLRRGPGQPAESEMAQASPHASCHGASLNRAGQKALRTQARPTLGLWQARWPQTEALCTLTDPARGADADEGDIGAAGVVQKLDELVQHDGGGRDAYAMLEPRRDACVTSGRRGQCALLALHTRRRTT